MSNPFFTIGHSTRPVDWFVARLIPCEVQLVVDVRTVPRSRTNPQFNRDALPASLAAHGIVYEHFAALGGLRGKQPGISPDVNAFWENASFHNYADYAAERRVPLRPRKTARARSRDALDRHVRGKPLVAMPSPDHCRLSDRRGRGGPACAWARPHRAGAHDARGARQTGWRSDLSGGLAAHARP